MCFKNMFKRLIVCLFCFVSLQGVTRRDDVPEARYVKLAKNPEFNSVGYIQTPLGISTGTLIDKQLVLTTAHSLMPDKTVKFTLINPTTNKPEEFSGRAYLHEYYAFQRDESGKIVYIMNDIALIRLDKPVSFVSPAKIDYDYRPTFETEFTSVGYGKYGTGSVGQMGVDRVKRAFCNRFCDFVNWPLTERYLFAYFDSPEEPDCCELEGIAVGGDSGAPIYIFHKDKAYMIGITSILGGNGGYGSFNAILPLSRFKLWIEESYEAIEKTLLDSSK